MNPRDDDFSSESITKDSSDENGDSSDGFGRNEESNKDLLHRLVGEILDAKKREVALRRLRKKRYEYPNLATVLWHTSGVIAVIMQEIIGVYHAVHPPTLKQHQAKRVCDSLSLLQLVASHRHTRNLFVSAHLPLFLYPIVNTSHRSKEFEYLRISALGVIGSLVKSNEVEVVRFLLSTEIIPLCLRIMECGTGMSKTVSCFILQKILFFDIGLGYICATPDRFYAVSTVLTKLTDEVDSTKLMKSIIRCYLRLADHERGRKNLPTILPSQIMDNTISDWCDIAVKRQRTILMMNLGVYRCYGIKRNPKQN